MYNHLLTPDYLFKLCTARDVRPNAFMVCVDTQSVRAFIGFLLCIMFCVNTCFNYGCMYVPRVLLSILCPTLLSDLWVICPT